MSRGLPANQLGSALLPRLMVVLGGTLGESRQAISFYTWVVGCRKSVLMVPLQRPEFAQTLHGGATTLAFRSRFQIIVFLLGFLLQSRSMSLHQFQSLSRGTCVPWPAWQSVMTHYCCCVCGLSGHQSCGFITCSSDSLFSGALLQAQCPRGKRRVASSRSNGRCHFSSIPCCHHGSNFIPKAGVVARRSSSFPTLHSLTMCRGWTRCGRTKQCCGTCCRWSFA